MLGRKTTKKFLIKKWLHIKSQFELPREKTQNTLYAVLKLIPWSVGTNACQWALGRVMATRACQWAKWFVSKHMGLSVSTRACRSVSGHTDVSVGTKVCQWAQKRVSGHTGLSVGTRACQWTQGSVNGHKSVLLYTKPVNGYKYTLEEIHL